MTKRSFLIYYNDYINPTPTKNQKAPHKPPQPHPLTEPTLPRSYFSKPRPARRKAGRENSSVPPPSDLGRINHVLHPSLILLFLHLRRLAPSQSRVVVLVVVVVVVVFVVVVVVFVVAAAPCPPVEPRRGQYQPPLPRSSRTAAPPSSRARSEPSIGARPCQTLPHVLSLRSTPSTQTRRRNRRGGHRPRPRPRPSCHLIHDGADQKL